MLNKKVKNNNKEKKKIDIKDIKKIIILRKIR